VRELELVLLELPALSAEHQRWQLLVLPLTPWSSRRFGCFESHCFVSDSQSMKLQVQAFLDPLCFSLCSRLLRLKISYYANFLKRNETVTSY
jgi:hypothetical protein